MPLATILLLPNAAEQGQVRALLAELREWEAAHRQVLAIAQQASSPTYRWSAVGRLRGVLDQLSTTFTFSGPALLSQPLVQLPEPIEKAAVAAVVDRDRDRLGLGSGWAEWAVGRVQSGQDTQLSPEVRATLRSLLGEAASEDSEATGVREGEGGGQGMAAESRAAKRARRATPSSSYSPAASSTGSSLPLRASLRALIPSAAVVEQLFHAARRSLACVREDLEEEAEEEQHHSCLQARLLLQAHRALWSVETVQRLVGDLLCPSPPSSAPANEDALRGEDNAEWEDTSTGAGEETLKSPGEQEGGGEGRSEARHAMLQAHIGRELALMSEGIMELSEFDNGDASSDQ